MLSSRFTVFISQKLRKKSLPKEGEIKILTQQPVFSLIWTVFGKYK